MWVQVALVLGVAALLWPSALGGKVDYVMVSGTSMEPGLQNGDLVIVRDTDDYEDGDAIAYRIAEGEVGEGAIVIHRITGGDGEAGFTTQGDNRDIERLVAPDERRRWSASGGSTSPARGTPSRGFATRRRWGSWPASSRCSRSRSRRKRSRALAAT